MKKEPFITVEEFCRLYNAEPAFITSLIDYDLIQIKPVEDKNFIDPEQLPRLEKLTHLYYDLEINIQGIDVINHLLGKIERMQHEMLSLQNSLERFHEE